MVLQKDGGEKLDRTCEKWRNATWSQGGEEYSTYNEKKEGKLELVTFCVGTAF